MADLQLAVRDITEILERLHCRYALMGGCRRDNSDIQEVHLVQGQLDVAYMRNWAKKLGVADSLELHLRESGHV